MAGKSTKKTKKIYASHVNFKYNNKSKLAKKRPSIVGTVQAIPKALAENLVDRGFGTIVKGSDKKDAPKTEEKAEKAEEATDADADKKD